MPKGELLGSFEQCVLLALIRLGENAYGMTIRREIESQTGRTVSLGAVSTTIDRLESKGYIGSNMSPGNSETAGRARRFFRLEPAGHNALVESLRAIDTMRAGLAPIGPSE